MKYAFKLLILMLLSFAMSACRDGIKEESKVESINITDPSDLKLNLVKGDDHRIRYSVVPESLNGTAVLEWSTSDPEVATVKNGRVSATGAGKAVITATCGDASASVNVTVNPVPVSSFTLEKSKTDAYMGYPVEINVSTVPEDQTDATDLVWLNDTPSTISFEVKHDKIVITPLHEGKGIIKVTSSDNSQKGIINVEVYDNRLYVSYCDASGKVITIPEGQSYTLKNFGYYNTGLTAKGFTLGLYPRTDALNVSDLTVTSSNENFLSCSLSQVSKNYVAAVFEDNGGFGSTEITVKYDDSLLGDVYHHFTLSREASSFTADAAIRHYQSSSPVAAEETLVRDKSIKVKVSDGSSSFAAKWESSNPSVASVSTVDGTVWSSVAEVKASSLGKATIRATDETGNNTLSFVVNVVAPSFTDDVKIIDESTGKEVEDVVQLPIGTGDVRRFRISDGSKGTWTSSSSAVTVEDGTLSTSAGLKAQSYSSRVSITVTDEAGLKSRTFAVDPRYPASKVLSIGPDFDANDRIPYEGIKSYSRDVHLYAGDGTEIRPDMLMDDVSVSVEYEESKGQSASLSPYYYFYRISTYYPMTCWLKVSDSKSSRKFTVMQFGLDDVANYEMVEYCGRNTQKIELGSAIHYYTALPGSDEHGFALYRNGMNFNQVLAGSVPTTQNFWCFFLQVEYTENGYTKTVKFTDKTEFSKFLFWNQLVASGQITVYVYAYMSGPGNNSKMIAKFKIKS